MTLKQTLIDDFTRAIPAALAEANRLATAGKLASQQPAQEQKSDDEDEAPPEQMSLF
jgi:hypothetical protein